MIQGQIIYKYKYRLQCQRTLGSVLIVNCEPNTVVIKVTKPEDGLLWTTQDIVQKTDMEKRSTKGKNKRRGDQRKI